MVDSVSTVLTLGQGELCWSPWLTLYRLIPDLEPRPFTRRKKGLPWALEVATPGRQELKGPQSQS